MYVRIRDLREDRDLTQTDVAKILEMSQTGYSKYETGGKRYSNRSFNKARPFLRYQH